MKLLLEGPRNVRELLAILLVKLLDQIDFDHMTRLPTSFVQRDYRHIEADVVLRAPMRWPGDRRGTRVITIYILIEHQSQPDPMMAFRVLEYVVQIYRSQARQWHRRHGSFTGLRLQPVLPVVFYTGSKRWKVLGQMANLVDMGEEFTAVIPAFEPLFLNLRESSSEVLEKSSGFFSWVLRIVQQRHSRPDEFRNLLRRVVEQLEAMPAPERLRWLELLSFVQALVYNERNPIEHAGLQQDIEASVRTDKHRKEVSAMGRTIAGSLIEQGRREGIKKGKKLSEIRVRREILVDQLLERFGKLSPETLAVVESCKNVQELDAWLRRVVTATTLDDVGLGQQVK